MKTSEQEQIARYDPPYVAETRRLLEAQERRDATRRAAAELLNE